MNKKIVLCLSVITAIALFFHFYKLNSAPGCTNADEAAFGYNAYSILKTGKDEYGSLLPLRLKSFGDYKMPVITYLTIPFVAFFGLNDFSIKLPLALVLLFFPTILYLFVLQLFGSKKVALLSALLFSCSFGIQSMSRQLHEALPTGFLITCAAFFLLKSFKNIKYGYLFILSTFISLFSYQSSRIFGLYFLGASVYFAVKKKLNWKIPLILACCLMIFAATDLIYKPQRVANLLFYKNAGFGLKIDELRGEGGSKIIYNKLTVGIKDVFLEYVRYFSPQFLAITGDENPRFGYPNLSPITIVEYLFFLAGLYFLFRNREKWRYYILLPLLISPLSAALSWALISITRSFFILIPTLIISSYGVINFLKSIHGKKRIITISLIVAAEIFFLFYTWDFYLNHYPKRALIIRAWQCGYKQLTDFVKTNYDKYDHFYVTKENGEPYIFFLYYLNYPPEKYQSQAVLSGPDKYGFGQIEKFDKFTFNLNVPKNHKKIAVIGTPFEVSENKETIKIKIGTEDMFWINEVN